MRVLKKKLLKEGVFKLAKERSRYEKPSDRKTRKKKEGIANFKKKQKLLRLKRDYYNFYAYLDVYILLLRLIVSP